MKTGISDSDGIDYGYKFVRKNTSSRELESAGPARVTGGSLWLWSAGSTYRGTFYNLDPAPHAILGRNRCVTIPEARSPAQTIAGGNNWKTVTLASCAAAAIKTDGTLWTWGYNFYGVLTGSIGTKSSPSQTVSATTNWKSVEATTYRHTFFGLKTDGSLWGWGDGCCFLFGNCCTLRRSSPVQTIAGGTNWSRVAVAANGGVAAIKTDGTIWRWGREAFGNYIRCPAQLSQAGSCWMDVAVNSTTITAIRCDRTMWTLGCAKSRANDCVSKLDILSSPVQESTLGTNWRKVRSTSTTFAANGTYIGFNALKTDGTLWGWGGTTSINLIPDCAVGDTTPENLRGMPVPYKPVLNITGCSKWNDVSVTSSGGVGVKSDGTAWTWGFCARERSSTGSNPDRSVALSPVQMAADKSGWKKICMNRIVVAGILQED